MNELNHDNRMDRRDLESRQPRRNLEGEGMRILHANPNVDVCGSREKVCRGRYRIVVTLPTHDVIYFALRGVGGWWLEDKNGSPITKVNSLLSAELKAQDMEIFKQGVA